MKDRIAISNQNDLNLIELSILFKLSQKYPRTVSIEEMSDGKEDNGHIQKNLDTLKTKGIIEQRFEQYRIRK